MSEYSIGFVSVLLIIDESKAWLGLNDQYERRFFEWSNGRDVLYTNWDLYQPPPLVTGEDSRCVAMNNKVTSLSLPNFRYQ